MVTLAEGIELSAPAVEPGSTIESDPASDAAEYDSETTPANDRAVGRWMARVLPDATLADGRTVGTTASADGQTENRSN